MSVRRDGGDGSVVARVLQCGLSGLCGGEGDRVVLMRVEKLSMLRSITISGDIRMGPLGIQAPSGLGHGLGLHGAEHGDGVGSGVEEFCLVLVLVGGYRFL
jgi:hypothetical protein